MRHRAPELHAAVLADPDDDAPRLVYADWLVERGEPWGELITVQIARTRADTPELAARERELLATLPHDELLPHERVYRRGFIEVLLATVASSTDCSQTRACASSRSSAAPRSSMAASFANRARGSRRRSLACACARSR